MSKDKIEWKKSIITNDTKQKTAIKRIKIKNKLEGNNNFFIKEWNWKEK